MILLISRKHLMGLTVPSLCWLAYVIWVISIGHNYIAASWFPLSAILVAPSVLILVWVYLNPGIGKGWSLEDTKKRPMKVDIVFFPLGKVFAILLLAGAVVIGLTSTDVEGQLMASVQMHTSIFFGFYNGLSRTEYATGKLSSDNQVRHFVGKVALVLGILGYLVGKIAYGWDA